MGVIRLRRHDVLCETCRNVGVGASLNWGNKGSKKSWTAAPGDGTEINHDQRGCKGDSRQINGNDLTGVVIEGGGGSELPGTQRPSDDIRMT